VRLDSGLSFLSDSAFKASFIVQSQPAECRSYDCEADLKAWHTVSAWASEHRFVLAEVTVSSKSNEITAIPPLLAMLNLVGAVVTMDAMGTQKTGSVLNRWI
jgi:hypothetical protein